MSRPARQLYYALRRWSMGSAALLFVALLATTSPDGRQAVETAKSRVDQTTRPIDLAIAGIVALLQSESEGGEPPLVTTPVGPDAPECKVGDDVRPTPEPADRH